MSTTPVSGSGRETRLLLLVIVVAVAMLLVLAQFRYPVEDRAATVPIAGPIERLAARATFEELSLIMADLTARVQDDLAVITIERRPAAPTTTRRGSAPPEPTPSDRRLVTALRVDSDLGVAYLPEGFVVVETPGLTTASEDPDRRLVLVHIEARTFTAVGPVAPAIGGPGYIAVFEGARGGACRATRVPWSSGLLPRRPVERATVGRWRRSSGERGDVSLYPQWTPDWHGRAR
ncbi:MAG: hypothetical protein O2917_07245 [Acidobacteria bacterium]|nr:hypothetical protein [Acidobacteriota bacterium]